MHYAPCALWCIIYALTQNLPDFIFFKIFRVVFRTWTSFVTAFCASGYKNFCVLNWLICHWICNDSMESCISMPLFLVWNNKLAQSWIQAETIFVLDGWNFNLMSSNHSKKSKSDCLFWPYIAIVCWLWTVFSQPISKVTSIFWVSDAVFNWFLSKKSRTPYP